MSALLYGIKPALCRGQSPISSFLWKNLQNFRREVEHMKLVEEALDAVIESCARQLFSLTDDVENSAYPSHRGRYRRLNFPSSCSLSQMFLSRIIRRCFVF